MTWIESHQELARHPKTATLARLLKCPVPSAIGHLHLLWWWATDYAQDGDLSRYPADVISEAVLWKKKPQELIGALQEAGFLDGLQIHDWDQYAGKLIEKRRADADRKRSGRLPLNGGTDAVGRPPDVHRTSDADLRPSGVQTNKPTGTNNTNHTGQTNKPDAAAVAAGFSAPPGDEEILDTLVSAFSERSLSPGSLTSRKAEKNAAIQLVRDGAPPDEIADCWSDVRESRYGTDFDRQHLSFAYLAGMNRLVNWRDWRDRGRPPNSHRAPRPISHAEALADPDRFNDPWLQDRSEKFKAMGRQHAANQRE